MFGPKKKRYKIMGTLKAFGTNLQVVGVWKAQLPVDRKTRYLVWGGGRVGVSRLATALCL